MTNDESAPPLYQLSDTNHAAWVVTASVIFFIYALLAVIAKFLVRFKITPLQSHDVLLLIAIVLFFAQTICVIWSCNAGLGQHQDQLTPDAIEQTSKFAYTSVILALIVFACTKISICLLINAISSQGSFSFSNWGAHRGRLHLANQVQFTIIIIWCASGVLAAAFQCSLPTPWLAKTAEQCPSRGPVHVYNGVMNIITDLSLCSLPIVMMRKVQTKFKRKVQVIALFSARIIVPIVAIPSISSASHLFLNDDDYTWLAVTPTIWLQVSLSLSIITASIHSLKRVIESLLGSTAGANIQPPYELTNFGGKRGLDAVAGTIGSVLSSKKAASVSGGHGRFKLYHQVVSDNQRSVCFTRPEPDSNIIPNRSDSTRNLTEGVTIMSDGVELQHEDARVSSSEESLNDGYHKNI